MNNGDHDELNRLPATTAGFGLDDVFYTLFRHKHIILAGLVLGLIGATVVRFTRQPVYESHAEISVPYISEFTGVSPTAAADQIKATDPSGLNLLNLEVRILSSLNLFTNVAQKVGPARILAAVGGGDDMMAAAGQIDKGLMVATPTRAATLTVSFRHPDKNVVQPVLAALIDAYQVKSSEIHQGVSARVDNLSRNVEESRSKLASTETEIKQFKATNNFLFPEDTKEAYKKHIARVQEELFLAREQLELRRTNLKGLADGKTNAVEMPVESELADEYSEVLLRLEELKKRQRWLVGDLHYTDIHPDVIRTKENIAELTLRKSNLEREYPALTRFGRSFLQPGPSAAPKGSGVELEDTQFLVNRVERLTASLTNLQVEASRVMELEPKMAALQRRHDDEQKAYQFFSSQLEKAQEGAANGNLTDVRVVQSPTPPGLDNKKLVKLVGVVFVGCVALGVGIAFLFDLVLDRTIKRSTDVKRLLHLPVMLTVPHTEWSRGWGWWLPRSRNNKVQRYDPRANVNGPAGETGVAPWNPAYHLRRYTDGLRERLITYFEVNQLGHHPKLVAVTSCGAGVGVTTLASGLAASLSMTGSGNVLLVDMNVGEGATHSFHKGKPGCGLSEMTAAEDDPMAAAANLYLAAVPTGDQVPNSLTSVLPGVFNELMPKLKVSGYDYIVFDMPPVSQTSLTPRLSSHMDIALLVIESEKTSKHVAAESTVLMREARVNVATILNKCKAHVPAAISTGF